MPTRNSTHAVFRAVDGSMSAQSLHISDISPSSEVKVGLDLGEHFVHKYWYKIIFFVGP